jgi:hypothetical protein
MVAPGKAAKQTQPGVIVFFVIRPAKADDEKAKPTRGYISPEHFQICCIARARRRIPSRLGAKPRRAHREISDCFNTGN